MRKRIAIATLAIMLATAAEAYTTRTVMANGEVAIRVGQMKVTLLQELGPPQAQQGGTWYYVLGRSTYAVTFGSDDAVRSIKESDGN